MELIGLKNEIKIKVAEEMLASNVGSGTIRVFSTPSMIALMEKASSELISRYLDEGITTVGTSVDIRHLAPTPFGSEVKVVAEIVQTDERNILFSVKAFDEAGVIGEGSHNRTTVKISSFLDKAEERRA